jgi:hypothetical protein
LLFEISQFAGTDSGEGMQPNQSGNTIHHGAVVELATNNPNQRMASKGSNEAWNIPEGVVDVHSACEYPRCSTGEAEDHSFRKQNPRLD